MIDFTPSDKYEELKADREDYIDRAEVSAELTIPAIFTEDNFQSSDDLTKNYSQSYGAKLVNNLTGKLIQALLPPNLSFFKLDPTPEAMLAVAGTTVNGTQQLDESKAVEAMKTIASNERKIIKDIEKSDIRKHYYSAVRLGIIAGEGLVEELEQAEHRVFNIKNYVVKRSPTGKVLLLIIREETSYEALEQDQQSLVPESDRDGEIYIYTVVHFDEGKYKRQIFIQDAEYGTETTYGAKFKSTPYNIVGWHLEQGEHYHRGFVELTAIADLNEFDKTQRSLSEYNAIVSKMIGLVDPNGVTDIKDLIDTPNGEFRIGKKDDVDFVQANKTNDIQYVFNYWTQLRSSLAEMFMMTSGAVRDSERTTALEVQQLVLELEASFGGTYSVWAEDIQKPIVEKSMKRVKVDLEGDVDLIITTGVQALGKSTELNKIYTMLDGYTRVAQLVGLERVQAELDVNALLKDIAINSGVIDKNYLLTPNQKGAQNSQAKQDALIENTLVNATTEAGKGLGQNSTQQ